jgi:hypothetical protein
MGERMDAIRGRWLAWQCLLALALSGPMVARASWCEMTVGHFHLYSTLSESATRETARQIQGFEQTVGGYLKGSDRLPDVPTKIYILSQSDFQKYAAGRIGLAGLFLQRAYDNLIVIDGEQPGQYRMVTVFHEYTHFIHRNSRTAKMPPWYLEGYAELYSSFSMKKNVVQIGGLPHGLTIYKDNWIPVERLLAVQHSDPEYLSEHLAPQFYGESWALVHMLLFDDKTLELPTRRYLEGLDTGHPEAEAFAASFPFDKQGLNDSLRKLLYKELFLVKTITLLNAPTADQAPVVAISKARADAELARLAFEMGRSPQLVDLLAARALSDAPADPAVRALSARITSSGEKQDVSDVADHLAQGGTSEVQLRIDVAATILSRAPSTVRAAQAVAILNDVAHDDDPPLEAIGLWAEAAERSGMTPPQFISILEHSSVRAPHNTPLLIFLARAHEEAGDRRQARDSYDRIILVSELPEVRLWAQKQADSARLQ